MLLGVLLTVILLGSISFGYVLGVQRTNDYDNVMEIISDTSKSNQEKILYLKERYDSEVAKWSAYKSYSDLCSPRYISDLKILAQEIANTSKGYEELVKRGLIVESESLIASTFSNHYKRSDYIGEMTSAIDKKQYESALSILKEIQRIDGVSTNELVSEIDRMFPSENKVN